MAKRKATNPTGKGGFGDRPQDINRGGFTAAQRAKHYEQHNRALEIREAQLAALWEVVENGETAEEVLETVRPEINKLIEDALDRWNGKPAQSVDLSSKDGSMSPARAESEAVLDALKAKHGAKSG